MGDREGWGIKKGGDKEGWGQGRVGDKEGWEIKKGGG